MSMYIGMGFGYRPTLSEVEEDVNLNWCHGKQQESEIHKNLWVLQLLMAGIVARDGDLE